MQLTFIGLIGGLGLFLYGMQLIGEGLQRVSGNKIKKILETLTKKKLVAVLLGIMITVLLQSSGATTVMLVGLVSASLMGMSQTIGVILGAGLGATFTVQLIAFRITDYALLMIGGGVLALLAGRKNKQVKYLGQAILGLGCIFFGMKIMAETMYPLREHPFFTNTLINLGKNPLLGVMTATVFSAVVQSSAATIGLTLSLANQSLISLEAAIPLVLGANMGTCATVLLSCMGKSSEAKRVAFLHLLIKVLGVLVLLPMLPFFYTAIRLSSIDLGRQIANAHTIFNLLLIFIFLPVSNYLARLVLKIIPDDEGEEYKFKPVYLDYRLLDTPALALAKTTKEIIRMADVILEMINQSMGMFEKSDPKMIDTMMEWEEKTDEYFKYISRYLTDLAEHALTREELEKDVSMLYIINDLEHIGDVVENLSRLARKKWELNLEFSEEGKEELRQMHRLVIRQLEMALAAFTTGNHKLADKAIEQWDCLRALERSLRMSHMRRLHEGKDLSQNSSIIHLDLINYFQRITDHIASIAYSVTGRLEFTINQ